MSMSMFPESLGRVLSVSENTAHEHTQGLWISFTKPLRFGASDILLMLGIFI